VPTGPTAGVDSGRRGRFSNEMPWLKPLLTAISTFVVVVLAFWLLDGSFWNSVVTVVGLITVAAVIAMVLARWPRKPAEPPPH
jgi:hypothetical protein